ncbi:interleukin-6 receptor subunit alpha [Hemicordylus capensis]|uniref:interleukin-6 receptor subunit alpha n=1 Tax=Hemicordylus capensis TaxID=884348 RepID=UPI0023035964|nr:interleukin-6 receptor subunit alpha [Hemicordylus capensis]
MMWLAGIPCIAALFLAAARSAQPGVPCPQPALPAGAVVCRPGANVTLRCLEGVLENSTGAHWTFEGQNLSSSDARRALEGSDLVLSSVYFNDSGRYSCHSGGRILGSYRLVVDEPLETPNFTCFRRSLAKNTLCEWSPSRLISPRAKATLWVGKGFLARNLTQQECRFYRKTRKFTCRIELPYDDNNNFLLASLCVVSPANSATSRPQIFQPNSKLKPDPPVDIEVNAVEKSRNQLSVVWQDPPSWGSRFYGLKFQLRYRAEISSLHSQVELPQGHNSYTIRDALPGHRYIVQVRGCEEFDHGTWSEWSREITGMPWTEPTTESETTWFSSTDSSTIPFHNHVNNTSSRFPGSTEKTIVEDAVAVPLYLFLLISIVLTSGLALATGFILRYRTKWQVLFSGKGKSSAVPAFSLAPSSPELPLSAAPLLSPPVSPCSESSVDTPSVPEHSLYDVSNADYFLLPK